MRTIQIDITNACTHQCSNCTRFCGHHRKPFFMDLETFQRAVDSLADFPRYIKNYILDESLNQRQGPGLCASMVEPYYWDYEGI